MYRVQNSGTANRRKSAREGEVGTEVSNAGRGKTARVRGKERDLIRAATLKFPISFDAQCSYRELRREFLVFLVYTVPTFSRRVLVRQLMSYSRCKKRKTWIGKEKKREREGERGRGNDRKNDARRTDRSRLLIGRTQPASCTCISRLPTPFRPLPPSGHLPPSPLRAPSVTFTTFAGFLPVPFVILYRRLTKCIRPRTAACEMLMESILCQIGNRLDGLVAR